MGGIVIDIWEKSNFSVYLDHIKVPITCPPNGRMSIPEAPSGRVKESKKDFNPVLLLLGY